MGTYNKGILGSFRGTVGTVVGSSWRGIAVMKSRSGKRKGLPSQAQLDQQTRFSMMTEFLGNFKSLLDLGFSKFGKAKTAYNSAFSYNLKEAISGGYGNAAIQYDNILLTKGKLFNAMDAIAEAAAGKVKFSWSDDTGIKNAKADDQVILAVYCENKKTALYHLNLGTRADMGAELPIPTAFHGKQVRAWISFISADGKEIADRLYLGELLAD